MQIRHVEFTTRLQRTKSRLTIPKKIVNLMGIKDQVPVRLTIRQVGTDHWFTLRLSPSSGCEVTMPEHTALKPGVLVDVDIRP